MPPPVCMPLGPAAWRQRGMLRDAAPPLNANTNATTTFARRHPAPFGEASTASLLASDSIRVSFEVGGSAVYHYPFPRPPRPDEAGSCLVHWPSGLALGPIIRLSRANLPMIHTDARPKLFLLVRGASRLWADSIPMWLPALHARHSHGWQFVLTEPRGAGGLVPPLRHEPSVDGGRRPTAVVLDGGLLGASRRVLHEAWQKGTAGEAALERLIQQGPVPQVAVKEEL